MGLKWEGPVCLGIRKFGGQGSLSVVQGGLGLVWGSGMGARGRRPSQPRQCHYSESVSHSSW